MHPDRWMPYWKHLRVPFSLTLAPIFLWGLFLSGGRFSLDVLLSFVGFHLFLYPGVTAYNSVFDRDQGPVGGMLRPPPTPPRLFEIAIAVQLLGEFFVTRRVLPVYIAYAALGQAYSHPAIRLKKWPYVGAIAVAIGQGGLGCLAGWTAGGGTSSPLLILGMAVAALTTFGLYPVGQVFQVEEDRNRGDRTLAVELGPERALRTGSYALAAAGVLASFLMARWYTPLDAALIAAAYLLSIWHVTKFAESFSGGEVSPVSAFRTSMRLTWFASGAFLIFIAWHWI